jgi:hypothetical protein
MRLSRLFAVAPKPRNALRDSDSVAVPQPFWGVSSLDFGPLLEGGFFLSGDAVRSWIRPWQQAGSCGFHQHVEIYRRAWVGRGRSTPRRLPCRGEKAPNRVSVRHRLGSELNVSTEDSWL